MKYITVLALLLTAGIAEARGTSRVSSWYTSKPSRTHTVRSRPTPRVRVRKG